MRFNSFTLPLSLSSASLSPSGSIQTAAVLQATAAESAYYVLKVRLSGIGDTTPLAKDTDGQMAIELQLVRW